MSNERLLRIQEVQHMVGFGKSMIYKKISEGTFPAPIKISYKISCWREAEIQGWISGIIEIASVANVPSLREGGNYS